MQKKTGVSLIVLVITVIVMVILAGTIILTINNTGIMERGESAVSQYNLNEITNIANIAWGEAYMNGARTEQELKDAVLASLTKAKITPDKYKGYELNVTLSGVTLDKIGEGVATKIPEGGTYYVGVTSNKTGDYTGATATYIAGDEFPTLNEGDVYVYGDYEYRYNYNLAFDEMNERKIWTKMQDVTGWGIDLLGNKSEYGMCLSIINGETLVSMSYLFSYDSGMPSESFIVPEGVIDTSYMFYISTVEKVEFKLPTTVRTATNMLGFVNGAVVTAVDFLNEGIEDISYLFALSSSKLPDGFIIPSSVTNMEWTFAVILDTSKIVLNAEPTNYKNCFTTCDMSKVTLAGSCDAALKQLIANTGENAEQVTIVD